MRIDWVKWEDLPEGQLKSFSEMFSINPSGKIISNIETEFKILKVAPDVFFPVTINNREWDSSFVCSPFTAYALYSKDEIETKIKNRFIRFLLLSLVKIIGRWLKFGQINKNIHVNNYLLSTNPYPLWTGKQINEITLFLKEQYPEHAIIFRSLNTYQHSHLLKAFTDNRYMLIGSRQVYMYDLTYDDWLKHRNNKHDLKLVKKQNLVFMNHAEMRQYIPQALNLYNKLYLEKYSRYNPQFSLEYFQTCYEKNIVLFHGYRDGNNVLKAFSGLFILGDTITSPLVGYDTGEPQKKGLYIHAAQLAILHKFKSGLMLNLSSGASKFKRMRGGKPSIEYSAVFSRHLTFKRRSTWRILQFLSNKIGVPLIDKYEL